MFKKLLLSSVVGLAFLAVPAHADDTRTPAPAAALGDFGVDVTAMDKAVRPGDDFYRYVNGAWLETFEIPADKSNYGSFTALADLSEERIRAIIEAAAANPGAKASESQKVGDMFASFMDEARVDALGLDPIRADLDAIAALKSHDEVADMLAQAVIHHGASPINFFINQDAKQPDRYIAYFTQSGLGLPDRDYYLEDTPRFNEIRAHYAQYITDMLSLADIEGAAEKAQAILALETRLAEVFWSRTESRDRDKTYNKMSQAELVAQNPGFPWARYLKAMKLEGEAAFIVRQPSAMQGSAAIFAETPVETWRAYLAFHLLDATAPLLAQPFVDRAFAFNGTVLSGVPQNRERWKRGVALVNEALGEAVGKIYVEKYFTPKAKAAMDELVANLVKAYEMSIKDLDWMGEETKRQALDKLAKFTPKIGYPDKWRDYSSLAIARDDLMGNAKRAAAFETWRNIAKLGQPVDRAEWFMTPQTVNAYYNPSANEIVFPAAILQPPFFDPNADPAVNYGGIGAVIGHEIGHGFDDQGRKSDGDGMLRDWWTADDATRFKARADKLVAQYDAYSPLQGESVNGRLTLGENIGDLGGLSIAYKAYRLSLDGKQAPMIDGYSGDQRFFLGWAQVWRRLYREAELSRRLKTDPHAPSEYRANGIVRNIDAWYAAFAVGKDDALYLAPEERVKIW
ncbi:MAG: M13 family metallopeptidase [Pseudomonadota bacterium]